MTSEPDRRSVTVRYWAGARAAAGVDSDVLTGCSTVADVVAAAVASRPALAPVARVSSLLLDGRAATPTDAVPDGSVLEVLPPFAGG
jgi:molybdopterin converting factor small subunit